ncbi:hypothetical protein Ocin01_19969 [Orchesella cincta]|uniref:Uncharacterized protein n=1 Tax=Orchesella cincta TaxID=48709 RepID=A0A1D2M182_ORCCI|nr:hypothetical protein Ocin01_19969 [Orchesella cincta]
MVLSNVTGGEMTVPNWTNFSGTTNAIVLTAGHKFVDGFFKVLKLTIFEEDFYTCGSENTCLCDSIRVFSFINNVSRRIILQSAVPQIRLSNSRNFNSDI